MNSITSRIQKKFDDLWYNSNLKSIDGIWKRMNKDGFKISNYQVRHLVHEKRREYIVDRDEESEDDEYSDDEEEEVEVKGEATESGPNVNIPRRISIFLKPPSVPQAYNPSRDPQFMFGVSLMKGCFLDDDGERRLKKEWLKPWQPLPPGELNKKRAEEAKQRLKEDKYTYTRNYFNPHNLNYNDRFH